MAIDKASIKFSLYSNPCAIPSHTEHPRSDLQNKKDTEGKMDHEF